MSHPEATSEESQLTANPDLISNACFSADQVAIRHAGTRAEITRAIIERTLEALEANGLITFVDPEKWPAFYVPDPPYEFPNREEPPAATRRRPMTDATSATNYREEIALRLCRDLPCINWDPEVAGGCSQCDSVVDEIIAPVVGRLLDAAGQRGRVTAAEVVRSGRDAFLSSDNLDPAWIAGWHAATDHHAAKIAPTKDAAQ